MLVDVVVVVGIPRISSTVFFWPFVLLRRFLASVATRAGGDEQCVDALVFLFSLRAACVRHCSGSTYK